MRFSLFKSFVVLVLLASAFGLRAGAQTAPPDSPFLPTKSQAVDPRSLSKEPFQLSAIGVVEGKTFVSIYETAEKRSRWIAVGGSLGNLQVVSCDVDAEQAVIRVSGELKTLTLPKSSVSTAAATASAESAPATTAAGATPDKSGAAAAPVTEEEQAREARMLVTDLLEIGMQQRKAYEDAHKKDAEPAAQPATAN